MNALESMQRRELLININLPKLFVCYSIRMLSIIYPIASHSYKRSQFAKCFAKRAATSPVQATMALGKVSKDLS